MRRGELFWGTLLILLGVLFFLKTAGYLAGDVFSWFWPFMVIAAGLWVLLGTGYRSPTFDAAQQFSVPLEGASGAALRIAHGMGRVEIAAGARPGDFLTGTSGAGMGTAGVDCREHHARGISLRKPCGFAGTRLRCRRRMGMGKPCAHSR